MMLVQIGWAQNDIHTFETNVKGRRLALRSYSADPIASYMWTNGKLEASPVKIHTLAVFTAKSVKLKKGRIVFEGKRETMVSNVKENRLGLAGGTVMQLEIDLQGADPATVLPQLQEMLFFPDAASATAALPEHLVTFLPFDISHVRKAPCNCKYIFDKDEWIIVKDSQLHPPRLIQKSDTMTSQTGGLVTLLISVSDSGQVGEIWFAKPANADLDEWATASAAQYVFQPALYDGRPVGTDIVIVMNYQMKTR